MKSKIFIAVLIIVLVPAFIYFWFSIGNNSFSISKWTVEARGLFAAISAILSLMAAGVYLDLSEKKINP